MLHFIISQCGFDFLGFCYTFLTVDDVFLLKVECVKRKGCSELGCIISFQCFLYDSFTLFPLFVRLRTVTVLRRVYENIWYELFTIRIISL